MPAPCASLLSTWNRSIASSATTSRTPSSSWDRLGSLGGSGEGGAGRGGADGKGYRGCPDGPPALDLLRGGARARPPVNDLVEEARSRGAALRRLYRWRPRDHGGGQSRRFGGEGAQCRADHLDTGRIR